MKIHKNLCCGCSLESPRRDDSNEHPQHRFYEEISKIILIYHEILSKTHLISTSD